MNINPKAITHFNSANNLYNSALYEEAMLLYKKAVEEDLSFYDAHFCIAKILVKTNKTREGLAYYGKYSKLIPKEKSNTYAFGLVNILLKEKQEKIALELLEGLPKSFNTKETDIYLQLLLLNNKQIEYDKLIINYPNISQAISFYNAHKISTQLKLLSFDNNNIPIFFKNLKVLKALQTVSLKDEMFSNLIESALKKIVSTKEEVSPNLNILNAEVSEIIKKSQENLFEAIHKDENRISQNRVLEKLIATGFDAKKINDFKNKIKEEKTLKAKEKSSKFLKFLLLSFAIVLLVTTIAYLGNIIFQDKKAYNHAVEKDDVNLYTQYLSEYGENEEIEKFREIKIYKTILENNNSTDIQKFIELYSESKFLRTIQFSSNKSNSFFVSGVNNTYVEINPIATNKYQLPYGAKIMVHVKNYKNDKKYFTVANDAHYIITDNQVREMINGAVYYINGSSLNLRENGENTVIIKEVFQGEPVKYLGIHKEEISSAYYLKKRISDYFYKVELVDGTQGWIHGGGLQQLESKNKIFFEDFKRDLLAEKTTVEKVIEEKNVAKEIVEPVDSLKTDTLEEIIEDTISFVDKEEAFEIESVGNESSVQETVDKFTKITCKKCNTTGKTQTKCTQDDCERGLVKTTCSACNGQYKNGVELCSVCDGMGCDNCDYDGQACDECNKGYKTIKHAFCNGVGFFERSCNYCNGKGFTYK